VPNAGKLQASATSAACSSPRTAARRASDAAEEVALVARAKRELLLRVHRHRLRAEDLEDCYSQATLELLAHARRGGRFASRLHLANTLEQRFVSRVRDRRRALSGRSPMQAALEAAMSLDRTSEEIEVVDLRAELETLVMLRHDLRRVQAHAQRLTDDQRLVLAAQVGQISPADFCRIHDWSSEKYRKVAQRARTRLRSLMAGEESGVPPAAQPPPGPRARGGRLPRRAPRRFSSARQRPGSGDLPAPGPGRPRARFRGGPMMLLRRAPREVYRVYGEEEFFATAADERSEPTDGAGEHRLQRVAGATVLLAAAGAVGGLIAITSLSTAAGARRRARADLLAGVRLSGHARAARSRVWREPTSPDGADRPDVLAWRGGQRSARIRGVIDAGAPRRARAGSRPPAARAAAEAGRADLAGSNPQIQPVADSSPAQPVHSTASVATPSQRSGQSEFGFER
jgi:DNA-directed RNA polymerase specialized sigma24 family protein